MKKWRREGCACGREKGWWDLVYQGVVWESWNSYDMLCHQVTWPPSPCRASEEVGGGGARGKRLTGMGGSGGQA